MADKKTATKKQAKEKKLVPMSSLDQKKYEVSLDQFIDYLNKNPGYSKEYKTGGRATHGYGKAYLKGGRVK